MSLPFLVYCSLLKRAQYKDLRDLANVHYGAVDITRVDQAMRDGIEKRLELAEQFLLFSEGLYGIACLLRGSSRRSCFADV